jgi:hypothetical protein
LGSFFDLIIPKAVTSYANFSSSDCYSLEDDEEETGCL